MITNYFRNLIQDNIFREDKSSPTSFYIAVSSTEPKVDGTGMTEPNGNGYKRVKVDRSTLNFTASANGTIKNTNAITWNESTGNWGTMMYYGIYDSLNDGHLLFGGTLTNPRTIEIETQMEIKPQSMEFTLS